eukprot:m.142697 g.142697  ORF g.142697 m.142697 type:complete len:339 (+) comp38367_c0_seq2:179-1195(+)
METNLFKAEFKKFKRKSSLIDPKTLIHFDECKPSCDEWKVSKKDLHDSKTSSPDVAFSFGLKPVSEWSVYTIDTFPGFLYIVDPFVPGSHQYWAMRCIRDYPLAPNACNLDVNLEPLDRGCLWEKHVLLEKKPEGHQVDFLNKLRWVTLGYHYDWDRKIYHKERVSEFPQDLSALSLFMVEALGFEKYQPEAGIVNFYHMDSSIAGHTDHSEYDLTAPLISYSFGQSAIFLLGHTTLDKKPASMYVGSGDVMIMSGDTRLSYHAVPKILPSLPCKCKGSGRCSSLTCSEGVIKPRIPDCAPKGWLPIDDTQLLADYFKKARINANVRQVLPHGGTFPE